jgi:hypothetical protein
MQQNDTNPNDIKHIYMTLGIIPIRLTTPKLRTFSIVSFSVITFSIRTLKIMTFSIIMKLCIMISIAKCSITIKTLNLAE